MPDWSRMEEDLRWCLIEGGIRVDGRDILYNSVPLTDPDQAQTGLRSGFMISQRDEDSISNFKACEGEDPMRLLNLARKVLGLKPLELPKAV